MRILKLEVEAFSECRIPRRIKESKLQELKLLADYDFVFQAGAWTSARSWSSPASASRGASSGVFSGKFGTGKSKITKTRLLIGCQKNFRCRYTTAGRHALGAAFRNSKTTAVEPSSLPGAQGAPDRRTGLRLVGAERGEARQSPLQGDRRPLLQGLDTSNIDFAEIGDELGAPVVTAARGPDAPLHYLNIDGISRRAVGVAAESRSESPE